MYRARDRKSDELTAAIEDGVSVNDWPFAIQGGGEVIALTHKEEDAHHIVRLLNGESKDWTAVGQALEALYEAHCEDDDCQDELDNLMEAYDKWLG